MIQKTTFFYLLLMLGRSLGLTSSICATVPEGSYVRSSVSCNSYNRCLNGQPHHGVCPKGYAFSPRTQLCDSNIEVDCRACSPFGIQHISNPDNCQMYYRCVNGIRTSMTCSPGLLFDRNFGDCNVELKVQCAVRNTICEPYRWSGLITIGNPVDCSSYYRCLNGETFEAACPSGLFYNPHSGDCEAAGSFCQGAGALILPVTPSTEATTRQSVATSSQTTAASTTLRIVYISTSSTVAPTTTTARRN